MWLLLGDVTFIDYTRHWRIFWTDGFERVDAQATTVGQCYSGFFDNTYCKPRFDTPYWSSNTASFGEWNQKGTAGYYDSDTGTCKLNDVAENHYHRHSCQTSSGGSCTTSGWDGSCPPGMAPNGSGMCAPRRPRRVVIPSAGPGTLTRARVLHSPLASSCRRLARRVPTGTSSGANVCLITARPSSWMRRATASA